MGVRQTGAQRRQKWRQAEPHIMKFREDVAVVPVCVCVWWLRRKGDWELKIVPCNGIQQSN